MSLKQPLPQLGIPHYFWYYGVYYLAGYIFAGLGLGSLYRKFTASVVARGRGIGLVAVGVVGGVLLIAQLVHSNRSLSDIPERGCYREIGLWLKEKTSPKASVACVEIGHIGWYSGRYIIDILGLVNPHNAELLGERKFDGWLTYYSPDYILVHDPLWRHESSARSLMEKKVYSVDRQFSFAGYTLLKKNP